MDALRDIYNYYYSVTGESYIKTMSYQKAEAFNPRSCMEGSVTFGKKPETFRLSFADACGLAAQVWCTDDNKHKVLDVEVTKEFARILEREVNYRVNMLAYNTPFPYHGEY